VTIDENLIRDVFLRVEPGDLDQVLTTIEAYRVCVSSANNLRGKRDLHNQEKQVLECARSCESALVEYVATGIWKSVQYPPAGWKADPDETRLRLMIEW
jgi:hypothetical protein